MAITVTMPQMGESVVEGTVERWLVREGDRVEKDQVLCEITTDKVDAEIAAPEAGVVAKILVPEGQTVPVGTELCVLEPAAAAAGAQAARPAEAAEAKPAAPRAAAPAAEAPAAAPRPPAGGAAEPARPAPGAGPGEEGAPPRRRASPLVERMAAEYGIDLEAVPTRDPSGRITREDLLAYLAERARAAEGRAGAERPAAAEAPAARAAEAEGPPGAAGEAPAIPEGPRTVGELLARLRIPTARPHPTDRVIPFTPIRRRIAEHMITSKIVSPHVGTVAEVDLHRVVALRERVKREFRERHGFALTYLPFVVQATVRALKAFPRMNASVVGETILEHGEIHIGVAVETDRGLVVPVVRNADHLSLVGLARAIDELARKARERTLSPDELQGGTFTVTNPGREGNLFGLAVIHQPQVGILRMGEVRKRPVVVEQDGADVIAIRPVMYLALSYDHRVIDGVTGNGFLYRVARELEQGDFEL